MKKIHKDESDERDKEEVTLASLRRNYEREALDEKSLQANPIDQFDLWFQEARSCKLIAEANAMTVSTAGGDLKVTSRTLLLKGYDKEGFRFFTNSQSAKGQQMAENPHAALLFYWPPLERQIKNLWFCFFTPSFCDRKLFFLAPS